MSNPSKRPRSAAAQKAEDIRSGKLKKITESASTAPAPTETNAAVIDLTSRNSVERVGATSSNLLISQYGELSSSSGVRLDFLNMCAKTLIDTINRSPIKTDPKIKTVRCQGLFNLTPLPSPLQNLLVEGEPDPSNIIVPANKANPNGTLARCLAQANYFLYKLKKKDIPKYDANDIIIQQISSATRGAAGQDKIISELITTTKIKLNELTDKTEMLTWYTKICGPLLDKGLSDIAQAGDLAKYYILQLIEDKGKTSSKPSDLSSMEVIDHTDEYQDRKPSAESSDSSSMEVIADGVSYALSLSGRTGRDPNNYTYWTTTRGLPYLTALSSDKIASALGIVIQDKFKGQFQSILPRKTQMGRFSVMYVPYKYISLMLMLTQYSGSFNRVNKEPVDYLIKTIVKPNPNPNLKPESVYNTLYIGIKKICDDFCACYQQSSWFATNNFKFSYVPQPCFTESFFMEINNLVDSIYNYYKSKDKEPESIAPEFSKDIFEIIIELKNYNFAAAEKKNRETDTHDHEYNNIIDILENFNVFQTIFAFMYNEAQNNGEEETFNIQNIFLYALNYFEEILVCYGNFIVSLSEYLNANEEALTGFIDTLMIENATNMEFPNFAGILYTSVSYYQNCDSLKKKTKEELTQLYLDICQSEETCAVFDVGYGHDQSNKAVKSLILDFSKKYMKSDLDDKLRVVNIFNKKGTNKIETATAIATATATAPIEAAPIETAAAGDEDIGEDYFIKNLIDKLKYCSVMISYSETVASLKVCITKDPERDNALISGAPGGLATKIVADPSPIGPKLTISSIDYIVGEPITGVHTKYILNQLTGDDLALIEFITTTDIIEMVTPSTDFDAAANSACLQFKIGKTSISYKVITDIPVTSGKTIKGKNSQQNVEPASLIHLILTYSLEEDSRKNNLKLLPIDTKAFSKNAFFPDIVEADITTLNADQDVTNKRILEMMTKFTKLLMEGGASSITNKAYHTILNFIDRYFKQPESEIKMLNSHGDNLTISLFPYFETLDKLRQTMVNKKTQSSITNFKSQSKPLLFTIAKTIGEEYIQSKNDRNVEKLNIVSRYVNMLLCSLATYTNDGPILGKYCEEKQGEEINREDEDKIENEIYSSTSKFKNMLNKTIETQRRLTASEALLEFRTRAQKEAVASGLPVVAPSTPEQTNIGVSGLQLGDASLRGLAGAHQLLGFRNLPADLMSQQLFDRGETAKTVPDSPDDSSSQYTIAQVPDSNSDEDTSATELQSQEESEGSVSTGGKPKTNSKSKYKNNKINLTKKQIKIRVKKSTHKYKKPKYRYTRRKK